MKKVLALVLAFAMMFSTITVAFAEPEVSAEAKALATVGMLEGDGNGVTAEYTAKEMTRFTAAISLLKLKGLYNDALAFKGDANFADVDAVKWEEGKNILAYLKANPGLGFGGNEKGEFNPNGNINEQSYYKVLLETLGYKQTTAEVAGDFAWAEVLEFAEKVGLKPAKAEKFTVDELAKATVGALKAKMKDGKVLINVLVEAGKVDKAKAVAAELMAEKVELTVAVKTAKAIGNTVVEVEYTDAVDKAAAEDLSNYSIEGLEIKSAMLDGTKKVLLETAAQTGGKKYTLVAGEAKVNFGGMSKIAGAPELKSVTGPDTNRVELTFDKVLDTASALDVANYAITGVTIVSGELDSARKVVTLTTEGMASAKTYTIKVTNIKSVDGVALKSASKSFYSKTDKLMPKLKSVDSKTYTRVLVTFNKLVNHSTALDIANYTIKAGSNELAIENITVEDNDDDLTEVEITTAPQKAGTKYELAVNNISDTSVLVNTLTKASKMSFQGKGEDKTLPVFKSFDYQARNKVVVVFDEKSRLDKESVLDAANYTFNNDIEVESVEVLPGEDAKDFKSVLLTVSELGAKSSYELKVNGVKDEYGNEMKEKKLSKSYNKTIATAAATVKESVVTKANEVKLYFTKYLDGNTAKDVANYSFNKSIGTPVKVTYKTEDGNILVTLTTSSDLVAGTEYKLTLNGLRDLAGNAMNFDVKVVGLNTENDKEAPVAEAIEAVNSEVVRITFDEKIDEPVGRAQITVDGKVLTAKVTYDDGKTLEFSAGNVYASPTLNLTDKEYKISNPVNIADKAGNKFVVDTDNNEFYGTSEKPSLVEANYEQTNVKTFKFVFSEKMNSAASFKGLRASIDSDDATIGYLKATSPIKVDKEFKDNLGLSFTNKHGVPAQNDDNDNKETTLTANYEDDEIPYIQTVEAINRQTIEIKYNEELDETYYGKYKVTYIDSNDKEKTLSLASAKGSLDEDVVTLELSSGSVLDSKYTYTLTVIEVAKDLAGNKAEKEEFSFEGSDVVKLGNYVTGVEVLNGTKFIVKLSEKIADTSVATLKQGTTVVPVASTTAILPSSGKAKSFTVVTDEVLQDGKDYVVTIGGMTYKFKGIIEDGLTLSVDGTDYVFSYSGMDKHESVVAKVYNLSTTGWIATGKSEIEIKTPNANLETVTEASFTQATANLVVISAVAKSVDGVVLYNYADSDLLTVIKAIGDAYKDPTKAQTAIDAIKNYSGASKAELEKLLDTTVPNTVTLKPNNQ